MKGCITAAEQNTALSLQQKKTFFWIYKYKYIQSGVCVGFSAKNAYFSGITRSSVQASQRKSESY